MPGTHSPLSRHLFTLDGSVLTSGGSKNLAKGQFTIVNAGKAGANGAVVVTDFAGQPDSTVYEMRLGNHRLPVGRPALNSKPKSSELFKINDVMRVQANYPRFNEQKFDDLLIGYDGITATTAIDLEENMTTVLDVVLSGAPIGFKTGEDQYVIKLHFGREEGETNEEVIRKVAERLKGQTLPGDIPITELINISVVDSENPVLDGVPYVFSTLTLTDEGDSNALARVQAQYQAYRVVRSERAGMRTVYTILHPQTASLANYSAVTNSMYIKNCADCGAGYTAIDGGFVYSITIEDDGADLTTTIDNVPGFVTGSVIRQGNRDGKGLYTVVTDDALTDAEIATYVGTAGVQSTATIELLGEVADVCSDSDTVSTAWVAGEVCYAQVQDYNIQLRDNDCGQSRLAELQAAYPSLTIEAGASTGNATQTVTLSGSSGAGTINIGGVNYTATYATSPTVTATNFVTANAAAILAATGVVVTSNAAVITFAGAQTNFPVAFANTSGNLAGALSAIDYTTTATVGACQRVYSTQVVTNVVCEECSDVFVDQFTSVAPADFDFTSWTLVEPTPNEDALMGLRLTGKPFIWYPGEAMRDEVPFMETSTRISVSGGYVEEVNQSFDPYFSDIFNIKRLSRAQDRDNLGGHLMQWEDASNAYFDGTERHKGNLFAKYVLGEESVLKFDAQYVQYSVEIMDSKYSQGVGRRSDMGTTYNIWAEIGYHTNLENYINSLAARAGLAAVQPLAIDFP